MNGLLHFQGETSIIHQLDPRIKLLWLLSNMLIIFFIDNIYLILANLFVIIMINKISKVDLSLYKPLMKIMVFIGFQFILFQSIFRNEGDVFARIGIINFSTGGVYLGLVSFLRLLILALLFLQFVSWTSPEELTAMGVKLGIPHRYAVLIGMTICFLPIVEKDLQSIYESQQSRGLELSTTMQKIKGLFPIIMPLILRSLKRTKEIALSMELKGYGLKDTRTIMEEISITKIDIIAMFLIFIYISLCIFILV